MGARVWAMNVASRPPALGQGLRALAGIDERVTASEWP
jgi:hypothetical protein